MSIISDINMIEAAADSIRIDLPELRTDEGKSIDGPLLTEISDLLTEIVDDAHKILREIEDGRFQ